MENSIKLFIGVLLATVIVSGLLTGLILSVEFSAVGTSTTVILAIFSFVLALITLVLLLGLVGILIKIIFAKTVKVLLLPMKFIISYYSPVVLEFAKLLRFDRDEMRVSFIQLGNQLVDVDKLKLKPEQILILTPHCLQISDCVYRVTNDINNCRRCGRCQVDDLARLKEKYGVNLAIATGGTLARRIIKEIRPKAIIAIACERDLTSGIQDTYPLPVIGVLNLRPHGPCINTGFEVEQIEAAIKRLIGEKEGEKGLDLEKLDCPL